MDIILTENFPQSFRFLNHAYPKLNNQPDVYINPYNPERFKTEKKKQKKNKKKQTFFVTYKIVSQVGCSPSISVFSLIFSWSFGLNSVSSLCARGKSSIAQKPEVHPKMLKL